jgi:citrate lyase subunit beta/citryl-CoA lyase
MTMALLRSFLYVPATRPERFAKAVATGAHAVIVDLEDAVAPADKDRARETLRAEAEALRARCDEAGCQLLVRPNARATQWHEADVEACAALPLHGVVVPKPDDAAALAALGQAIGKTVGKARDLYLLVESLAGFRNIEAISRAPGVRQMMLGAADLMLDIGITHDDEPLHYFRSLIVMHSRLAGLPAPVDGVCLALEDDEQMQREIARAKRFGFGAKLCVHPRQVQPIHQGFSPSAADIAWARRVVEAAGAAEGAAVKVDGQLVDAPILEHARRLLRSLA